MNVIGMKLESFLRFPVLFFEEVIPNAKQKGVQNVHPRRRKRVSKLQSALDGLQLTPCP